MLEYGKTQNLFARDPDTHELDYSTYRQPEVALVGSGNWLATEKIDGTNVRIIITPLEGRGTFQVELRGRSDRATLPGDVETPVISPLAIEALYDVFGLPGDVIVTFYGELYGGKIQKMSEVYGPEKRIAVFDCLTTRDDSSRWLGWSHVQRAAALCSLETVPVVMADASIDELVQHVGMRPYTRIKGGRGDGLAEGIVARTDPYLYDSYGSRVFFKLKARDLA